MIHYSACNDNKTSIQSYKWHPQCEHLHVIGTVLPECKQSGKNFISLNRFYKLSIGVLIYSNLSRH